MSETPPPTPTSSFQNLMEHKCEIIFKNPETEDQLCATELFRDLYRKHYELLKLAVSKENLPPAP